MRHCSRRSSGNDDDAEAAAVFARSILFFFGVDEVVAGRYPRREVDAIAVVMAALSKSSRDSFAGGLLREYATVRGSDCGFVVAEGTHPPLKGLLEIKRQAMAHYRRLMTVN